MKNYTKLQTKFIEEIQSNVTVYSHNKTKARICTIENDDNNKVFSIAFRTPPINNCGLTHILEHSVLCGSKKYPVKDPFVELLKSSLNTFLNAFTFPDKTMYPCASQNDADFKNLMSVYMDAVFYPQIYNHEEIFMQEGWHYHLENENDPITYNGVVYNEMKGAFSNPDQILMRCLMHQMYPDTAYSYESGGDPKYIPELTYEVFKDFHSKYYHPTNSYIFIYGNCDMEERMEWLDKEYLSNFDEIDFDTTIKYQTPFEKPIYKREYYQVSSDTPMENKAFLSYSVAFPTTLNQKLSIASTILMKVLFDNPGAPLKEALIKANLGQDVQSVFDDGLLQPLLSVIVVNASENDEERFISIINEELQKIVDNGLDKEALLSIINFAEFKARERAFSANMPQGLDVEMTALNSWLYDDNDPFSKLETLKYFKELKEEVNTGYFESIIRDYILNNTHKAFVSLVPSKTCNELEEKRVASYLAEYKNSLSKEEILELIEKNKKLAEYQSTPSTKEEIDTLPKLKLEDISTEPEKYELEVINNNDYKTLFSKYHTNDICYYNYYFDVSNASIKEINYISLFTDIFTSISTDKYSYKELNQQIMNKTGGLSATVTPYATYDNTTKVFIKLSFSALNTNASIAQDILLNALYNSNYSDEVRLQEKLNELKANLDMSVSYRGHVVALTRALSYIESSSRYQDSISGINYIDFISDLCENFETKKNEIISMLYDIVKKYISKEALIFAFTGSKNDLEASYDIVNKFYNLMPDKSNYKKEEFKACCDNEGFLTEFNVNYVARAGHFTQPYNGSILVLQNAISLDYLWQQVRVLGGAYGCMINIKPNGYIGFTSYRDPNISRTNNTYQEVVKFIEGLNPTKEELLKYKIGTIGNLESVMHVKDKATLAQRHYLTNLSYETRRKIREEAISCTNEDLNSFKDLFTQALKDNALCVIGNKKTVENNKSLFNNLRNLTK